MAVIKFAAGEPADIVVEYTNTKPPAGSEADISQPALMRGVVSTIPMIFSLELRHLSASWRVRSARCRRGHTSRC